MSRKRSGSKISSAGKRFDKTRSSTMPTHSLFSSALVSKLFIEDKKNLFDRLPVEVVEHIFTFSDLKDLKACSMVCQRFNEIISGSCKVMRRFVLHIDGKIYRRGIDHDLLDLRKLAAIRRRYQRIKIVGSWEFQTKFVLAVLRENGCKVTDVKLEDCVLPKEENLLSCFPNVVKLEITGIFYYDKVVETDLLSKLKHLKLGPVYNDRCDNFNPHLRILSGASNLATLDVHCGRGSCDDLSKLLGNQRSLDTLHLRVSHFEVYDFDLNLHSDLKVRQLFVHDESDKGNESLLALKLTLQFGGKVEDLHYLVKANEEILLKILQHFPTIKTLTLKELPSRRSFYDRVPVNTHLNELVISKLFSCTHCPVLCGVFKAFPNLKKLSVVVFSLDNNIFHNNLRLNNNCCYCLDNHCHFIDGLRLKLNQLERFFVVLPKAGHSCMYTATI